MTPSPQRFYSCSFEGISESQGKTLYQFDDEVWCGLECSQRTVFNAVGAGLALLAHLAVGGADLRPAGAVLAPRADVHPAERKLAPLAGFGDQAAQAAVLTTCNQLGLGCTISNISYYSNCKREDCHLPRKVLHKMIQAVP